MLDVFQGPVMEPDRLALMQRAALLIALSWRDEGAYRSVLQAIDPTAPIHTYAWVNPGRATPPGWCIHSQGSELIITIRGTSNINQWFTHVGGSWGVRDSDFSEDVWFHMWMFFVARDAIWPTVQPVLANPPPGGFSRIRVIGHSYGAGLAALLGRIIWTRAGQPDNLEVTTFGSPRVLAADRPYPLQWEMWNVFGTRDVVTRVPPPWGSARMVTGTVTSAILGRFGAGALSRFAASQGTGRATRLPSFRHFGTGVIGLTAAGRLSAYPGREDTLENTPGEPNLGPADGHLMNVFYFPALLRGAPDAGFRASGMQDLVDIVVAITTEPQPADEISDWTALSRPHWAEVARVVFPGVPPPTEAEFLRADSVAASTRLVSSLSNIGPLAGAGGGPMADWKFTAYISWGQHGRSVSIHRTGLADFATARDAGLAWSREYSKLFGDAPGDNPFVGGFRMGIPGSPQIEWLKVSDPLTPRISQRYRVGGDNGSPAVANSAGFESDVPWVGLSLSILATTGGRTTRDTVSILGQMDKCVEVGSYKGAVLHQSGVTMNTMVQNYLNYILPPAGAGFGTMGRNHTLAPDRVIESFAVGTDGQTVIEASTADWVTMEFIKINSSGVPYYNREWRIRLNEDGTYTLLGSRPTMALMPRTAVGYRTRLANRVKQLVFYPYSEAATSFNPAHRIFVSKRNPAAVFSPLASRSRRRIPAK